MSAGARFVRGSWRIARVRGTATLRVTLFAPLAKRDAGAVRAEGRRLPAFAAADADDRRVELAAPA